jgi:hypothetical protein
MGGFQCQSVQVSKRCRSLLTYSSANQCQGNGHVYTLAAARLQSAALRRHASARCGCRRPTNALGFNCDRKRAFTGPAFASVFMGGFEAGLYRERESNVKATQVHFSLIPMVCRARARRYMPSARRSGLIDTPLPSTHDSVLMR